MMMTMVKVLMVMVTMMMVMVTGPGSTWPAGTVAVTQFGEKIQIAKSILLLFLANGRGGGVSYPSCLPLPVDSWNPGRTGWRMCRKISGHNFNCCVANQRSMQLPITWNGQF